MTWCALNGTLMRLDEATISPMDRGFLFGDGVYEVLALVDGVLRARDLHAARLAHSLQGIQLDVSVEAIFESMDALIERSGLSDAKLYIQVTRGASPVREHVFPGTVEPTVFLTASPFQAHALAPSRAIVRPDIRWHRNSIKSVSLLGNVLLAEEARQNDAAEAILHRDGEVTEASTSNVFLLEGGALRTPPLSEAILPGITRHLVLELAEKQGLTIDESPVMVDDLTAAETVFVTSSTRGLLPIVSIDPGGIVGNGTPVPQFEQLQDAYQARLHHH